jgi:hypothetical protein
MRIEVSNRIKEEFENGRDYYRLQEFWRNLRTGAIPSRENLRAHYEEVFRR